ncbi:MAG: flagellar export chaperone FlgN [bacterium]
MISYPYNAVSALTPAGLPSEEMLADALSSETKLVEELIAIMRRQRAAVAVDDLQGVDSSVFATHRVLATLKEARRRRHALNRMLGEREDFPLEALDEVLGQRMTERLGTLRSALQLAARDLSRQVTINRQVLRHALAGGEAYLRTLTGEPAMPTYSTAATAPDSTRDGVLVNRTA